ncbi:MAG TPA: methionyl-tRNA formyltransferase [Candidatus Limnocylindrales bacterium]|nr:methionyl-tRNA formyltransferase [Candidatus Limnocylindrales bacterium]
MPLRIIFCGTPAFSLPSLKKLLADPQFSVEAVITQPDQPAGRGKKDTSSPVKSAALAGGVQVYQPEKIKSLEAAEFLKHIAPDAAVIIAYGQIIPRALLDIPRLGWINLHASLLPRYRGAAPIQRAILNGDTRTGLTTMKIDAGLDTGPILEQLEVAIGADETAPQLMARMGEAGAPLLIHTLQKLSSGELEPKAQDPARATFAPPIKKEEGLIDWAKPASEIYSRIRAFDPWPGTYSQFRGRLCHISGCPADRVESPSASAAQEPGTIIENHGEILVACGEGTWLRVAHVHLEGRKRVTAREFANGARISSGERFT